jgi:Tfp pilus assembly protein PilO
MDGSRNSFNESILRETQKYGSAPIFFIVLIISLGLAYLVYTFLLGDWMTANDTYRDQIIRKELENEKTEKMLAGEKEFRVKYNKIVSLYDKAKPLLPEETEISEVLGQVETAANRNGVTLTGLKAVKASVKSPRAGKLYEREIPALVTGPYPQVVRFFTAVSQMPRILVVRDYSVVSLKNTVSAGFTLVAYHAPPPGEKPATKGNLPVGQPPEVNK